MNEELITNRLCYLFLGLLIGIGLGFCLSPTPQQSNINMKLEIQKDSVKTVKMVKLPTAYSVLGELEKHNIPHKDIVLAQAKLESNHFKSNLVQTHNNIFGLKKGNKYRKYNDWKECIKDYKKCISNRYKGGDYYIFLTRINYSEDPKYINKLKQIIQCFQKFGILKIDAFPSNCLASKVKKTHDMFCESLVFLSELEYFLLPMVF